MTMIADLNKRARDLKTARDSTLAQRKQDAANDHTMTNEQRAEYVANWKRNLDNQYRPKFDEIREEAAALSRSVKRDAERVRPKVDQSDTAALIRTEQAWRNVVLPQLEKGRTLREALAHADIDATLGAERFAAGWLQSQAPKRDGHFRDDSTANASVAATQVTLRLSELVDGTSAEAIREAATIDAQVQALSRSVDHIETGAGSGLEAAIGLHLVTRPGAPDAA